METKLNTIKLNFEVTLDVDSVNNKFTGNDIEDIGVDLGLFINHAINSHLDNEPFITYVKGGNIHYDSIVFTGISENQEKADQLLG